MKFDETVLVVDDEEKVVRSLKATLSEVAEVVGYTDPREALESVRVRPVAVAIVDQRMPEMTGTDLLIAVRQLAPNTIRFLLTGYSDLEAMAVAINESQVHRYLEKPWDVERLARDVEAAIQAHREALRRDDDLAHLEARSAGLESENMRLRMRIRALSLDDEIVTVNPEMERVLDTVQRIAVVSNVVLIYGESGTGKELVARRIHAVRHGPNAAFVALNCGAFSEGLVLSELFGHEKGAFTGAVKNFPGAFERAHRGTLFLDEVGDLRPDLQVKLLRVLEEGAVRRLGGTREIPVDVTVLTATHQDLRRMVAHGDFREDLYYRLSVIDVHLPPLRERTEDIPVLLEHFMKRARSVHGRPKLQFTPEAVRALMAHPFRGNVRELRNIVLRVAAVTRGDAVQPEDLPVEVARPEGTDASAVAEKKAASPAQGVPSELPAASALGEPFEPPIAPAELKAARSRAKEEATVRIEHAFLSHWHEQCAGNIGKMSKATGLSRAYLYKMAKRSGFPLGGNGSDE